jgi:hypothetical protein
VTSTSFAYPESIEDKAFTRAKPDVIFAVIRDPLALLVSTVHHPYDLFPCVRATLDASLREPCSTPTSDALPVNATTYAGFVDYWNQYAKGYANLADGSGAYVLRYEDVVRDPRTTFQSALAALGIARAKDDVLIVDESAKMPGDNGEVFGGRSAALAKLEAKTYLKEYSVEALAYACEHLDHGLLRRFHYEQPCLEGSSSRPVDPLPANQ